MLPATFDRVPRQTAPDVNERIRRQTVANLVRYRNAAPEAIARRLDELDHEWDIERAIEANAAGIALAGVAGGPQRRRDGRHGDQRRLRPGKPPG
jgi:hypothetical protein